MYYIIIRLAHWASPDYYISRMNSLTERDLSTLICSLRSLVPLTKRDLSTPICSLSTTWLLHKLKGLLTERHLSKVGAAKSAAHLNKMHHASHIPMQSFTQHSWPLSPQRKAGVINLAVDPSCLASSWEANAQWGHNYWHYYSAAMPLFSTSSLAFTIPSLHSCGKYQPSILVLVLQYRGISQKIPV